ncbi:g1787 [Coccomyxa viridis]|uniref:G1787 protein n=1 Tax=Coccomyxa viridis TaxID=1274662 RepID=A0ABP1FP21_9CHLO
MASGHGKTVEYAGLKLHEPEKWHKYLGEGLASLMWFWIFVRAYHDGSTLLFGHAPHFEHELEHEAHGHGEHDGEHH